MVELNKEDYAIIYLALQNRRYELIRRGLDQTNEFQKELKQLEETLDKIVDIYFFRK